MKKINLFIFCTYLMASTINAQTTATNNTQAGSANNTQTTSTKNSPTKNNVKFALSPSVNLPTGLLGQITSVGLGVDAMVLVDISPKAQFFSQLGYQNFIGKNLGLSFNDFFDFDLGLIDFFDTPSYTKVPNISNINFIVGARTNINSLLLGTGIGFGYYSTQGISQTGFSLSPQIGYATKNADFIFHWTNSFATLGSLGNTGIKAYFRF